MSLESSRCIQHAAIVAAEAATSAVSEAMSALSRIGLRAGGGLPLSSSPPASRGPLASGIASALAAASGRPSSAEGDSGRASPEQDWEEVHSGDWDRDLQGGAYCSMDAPAATPHVAEEDDDAASATATWRAVDAPAAHEPATPLRAPAQRHVPIYGALLASGASAAAARRGALGLAGGANYGVGAAVAAATAALAADDCAADAGGAGATLAAGPGIAFRTNSLQSLLQIVNAGGMSNEDFLASLARGGLRSVLRQPAGPAAQHPYHLQPLPYEDGDGAY
ncbi:hypothetical protein GPECTOR_8g160 [Gonium pectorale]|uniref:Uncharacterized protein n=1 Tax=Gonium pectorale TaxID=33097 RepID=A0A150GSI5_GONPE|nr:hypothetical protein GPECTOR_8g160 [Gonium pectorale]|eukprot:KXZ52771.1 hypothetical protein GPECTOR_8g160 [Gonium pectorale]